MGRKDMVIGDILTDRVIGDLQPLSYIESLLVSALTNKELFCPALLFRSLDLKSYLFSPNDLHPRELL